MGHRRNPPRPVFAVFAVSEVFAQCRYRRSKMARILGAILAVSLVLGACFVCTAAESPAENALRVDTSSSTAAPE